MLSLIAGIPFIIWFYYVANKIRYNTRVFCLVGLITGYTPIILPHLDKEFTSEILQEVGLFEMGIYGIIIYLIIRILLSVILSIGSLFYMLGIISRSKYSTKTSPKIGMRPIRKIYIIIFILLFVVYGIVCGVLSSTSKDVSSLEIVVYIFLPPPVICLGLIIRRPVITLFVALLNSIIFEIFIYLGATLSSTRSTNDSLSHGWDNVILDDLPTLIAYMCFLSFIATCVAILAYWTEGYIKRIRFLVNCSL